MRKDLSDHRLFRQIVHRRCGLVQNDQILPFQKQSRQRRPLLLSAGKQHAPLSKPGFQPLRQLLADGEETGADHCGAKLLLRRRFPEIQILPKRPVKDRRVLRNIAQPFIQAVQPDVMKLHSVQANTSRFIF